LEGLNEIVLSFSAEVAMKRGAYLLGGLAVVLIGLAFIMPAVALMRQSGALPTFEVGLLLLGIGLTAGGAVAMIHGARRRLA
jgi:hypothetical protein